MANKTQYILEVMLGASTNGSYRQTLNRAARDLEGIGSAAKRAAGIATAAFAAVQVGRVVKDAVSTYAEFEQAMANTAATAGASAYEYELLENAAREAGRSTTKTATESAEALGYMALAGWDARTSTEALIPVLRMSEATGAELKTTSDLVTDSMSALGLQVSDLMMYEDKLVMANNKSNTTAEQLMEALVKSGGAARALGADLDDTTTALGILANNGLKGSEAGTALNAILTRLATNSKARDQLEALQVSIFDTKGEFVGLEEVVRGVNEALSSKSAEEQTAALKQIAGTHYYSQMKYLLDGVAEGADGAASAWEQLEENIVNSEGALNRMNARVTDTLPAAWERLKSAVDDAKISLVDVFADDAKDGINWLAERLPEVTEKVTDFVAAHRGDVLDALEGAGNIVTTVWGAAKVPLEWLLDHSELITGALTSLGVLLAADKLAGMAAGVTSLATGLMSLGPAGAALLAVAGAAGAFNGIRTAISNAEEAAAKQSLSEHFGTISLSMYELDEAARQVIGSNQLNMAAQMLDAVEESAGKLDKALGTREQIFKTTWRLQAGFELDKTDSEDYSKQITAYIEQAQNYLDQKTYEVHVGMSLLFGAGSDQELESNAFYASLDKKLDKYNEKISKKLESALEDGIIDIDENTYINKYLEKINNIVDAVSRSESESEFDLIKLKYNGKELTYDDFNTLTENIRDYVAQTVEAADNAYTSAMARYHAQLELDDGYTQEQYNKDVKAAARAHYEQQADAYTKGLNYLLETIMSAYPEAESAIKDVRTRLIKSVNELLNEDLSGYTEADIKGMLGDRIMEALVPAELPEGDINALRQLIEGPVSDIVGDMTSLQEQMSSQGMPISQSIADSLAGTAALSAITGSADEMYTVLGSLINENNPEAAALIEAAKQIGFDIPDGTASQITVGTGKVRAAMSVLNDVLASGLQGEYNIRTKITTDYSLSGMSKAVKFREAYDHVSGNSLNTSIMKNPYIYSNAEGGIYRKPILTTFAEDGPEAAIPLDGSSRAKDLWVQAGRMLGIGSGASGQRVAASAGMEQDAREIKVVFSPNITIQGNASEEHINNSMHFGITELKRMLREIEADRRRTSMA